MRSIDFVVIFSPILFFAEYSDVEYVDGSRVAVCLTQASNGWRTTFFVMNISIFFLLPLIVLIVLYTIIAKKLIVNDLSLAKMRPNKPELSYKARKQVILMLGAVVMAFFTCLLPFRVLTLWIIIAPHEYMQALGMEAFYNLLYFCRIMLYLNSAINPILYNLMSSKFRKGFKKLFYCYCLLSVCNRKQHKLNLLKRHHQNSHTTSSHTHTTSLTMTSRKNSSKMSNEETKILHHVELNCSATVREMVHGSSYEGGAGGAPESGIDLHGKGDEEEDEEDDSNNIEYELQLRMIDRKSVFLAQDLRRPPFIRQTSNPTTTHACHVGEGGGGGGYNSGNMGACCGNGLKTYHHHHHRHRHTIHLNDVELGNAVMRRNLLSMNKKWLKRQRLNLNAKATTTTENVPPECVTRHQLRSQPAAAAVTAVEIKRQESVGEVK